MNRIAVRLTMTVASIATIWISDAFAAGAPSTITCSRVIIPVCGNVKGVRQSFPNACVAHRAGATGIVAGNCKPQQVVCPTIYHTPVCALENGRLQTYSNSCVATNEGAKVLSRGHCDNN
jgi:Kazal-type serine protease inhibitor domain